MKLQDFSYKLP